jgi:hypothetical protein
MAENKKGFVLYADLIHTVSKLPNEIKGKLFQLILDYVNDKNPVVEDLLLEISFEPIKQQFKRDLVKWDKFRQKQSDNGKRGGRPKKPSLLGESQKSLKVTVTDTVKVKETVIVKENEIDARKLKFASTLEPFLTQYGKEMLNAFYKHWAEPNKSGTKFRMEGEKFWDLSKRLSTWASREKGFNKEKEQPKQILKAL